MEHSSGLGLAPIPGMVIQNKGIQFKLGKGLWAALAVYFIVTLAMPIATSANTLRDFSSDGCSKSPDGVAWDINAFLECCIDHDVAYWHGGTRTDRFVADARLRQCISDQGYKEIADAYFVGVRVGGSARYDTSYRWGYGWTEDRGDAPLTKSERREVSKKLKQINWNNIYNSIFLGNIR